MTALSRLADLLGCAVIVVLVAAAFALARALALAWRLLSALGALLWRK